MDKVHCALCGYLLKHVEFNLKTVNSKHSHTPLIALIEKNAGTLCSSHFNICLQCYDLINELDAIELRQIEIHNRLKKYIEYDKQRTCLNSKNEIEIDISTMESTIIEEITDINLFTGIAKGRNNVNNELYQATGVKSNTKFCESDLFDKVENKNENNLSDTDAIFKVNLKSRGRKKYPDVAKPHKCHCSKEFRTMGELKSHMNSHSNHRPFVCDICGLAYKYKPAFTRHMDMHNGINPFTCVYCNKSFTQKVALIRHVPIHTGEKPYQCDECGKRFIHHTSFNIHRLSHTGQKSYKCTVCELALMSGSHLKRHMRIHTGEKNFTCSTCGRRFAEKYNLAAHEKLHFNPKSILSIKPKCSVEFNDRKENWINGLSAQDVE